MTGLTITGLYVSIAKRDLLQDVSVAVARSGSVAIMGPSGSGKTTLMHCIAGIVRPTGGTIVLDGTDVTALRPASQANFRLRKVGMVFQFGELLEELTLGENVGLPLQLAGVSRTEAQARAARWIDRFGLGGRFNDFPDALSGGEVQRIGIARALVTEPALIVADEPTGALDEENSRDVTRVLLESARETGAATVIATHDPLVADQADVVMAILNGRLVQVEGGKTLTDTTTTWPGG